MMSVLTYEGTAELSIATDGALDYCGALEGIETKVTSADCHYTAGGRAT
jgi:hypothetical protein